VARPLDDRAIPCSGGAAAATRYSGHSEAVNKQTHLLGLGEPQPLEHRVPFHVGHVDDVHPRVERRHEPRLQPMWRMGGNFRIARKLPDRMESSASPVPVRKRAQPVQFRRRCLCVCSFLHRGCAHAGAHARVCVEQRHICDTYALRVRGQALLAVFVCP
jgi:hypothetical protein